MRRRLAVLGVAAVMVAGCGRSGGDRPPSRAAPTSSASTATVPGSDSPAARVVERFFAAAAEHDAATARSLLSDEARRFQDSVVAPWWGPNTISLTGFRIFSVRPSPGSYPSDDPSYTDVTQVTVEFDVTFADEGQAGAPNGATTSFTYVGRRVDGDGWRILSLGGGP
jgi:hypothetical protein